MFTHIHYVIWPERCFALDGRLRLCNSTPDTVLSAGWTSYLGIFGVLFILALTIHILTREEKVLNV